MLTGGQEMYGETLIDKARSLGLSDAKIADRIGISPTYVQHVMAGRKKLSPEVAALLADLVGDDAREALAQMTVENASNVERRTALQRVLFGSPRPGARPGAAKHLAAAVACVALILGLVTDSPAAEQLTVYTLCAAVALLLTRTKSRSVALQQG